jgi:hypothetical protein
MYEKAGASGVGAAGLGLPGLMWTLDHSGWTVPGWVYALVGTLSVALILLSIILWVRIALNWAREKEWAWPFSKLIPLADAATELHGEIRGTLLATTTEELAESSIRAGAQANKSDLILNSLAMRILRRGATLHFEHPPSKKVERLPKAELKTIHICGGAKGFQKFGRGPVVGTNLQVRQDEFKRAVIDLKNTADQSDAPD